LLNREQGGRIFRTLWTEQVYKHIPNPKESYVQPWENMPEWEKESAMAVFEQVQDAIAQGQIQPQQMDREQGGRFIRERWVAQIYKHIPNPKEAYVQPWENMPAWEQETDSAIFEGIVAALS
jgi:hypothetical protein